MSVLSVEGHPADAAAALWARVLEVAEGLEPGAWQRPTPCPGWDLKDLLGHLGGIQTAFDGTAAQPSPPDGWSPPASASPLDHWTEAAVAARRGWTAEQVRAELRAAAAGHEARLRAVGDWDAATHGPTGPTTEQGLFVVRCFDLWVHLQDLHEALGRPLDDDDSSPGAIAAYSFVLERLPWLYAKRVDAPDGSALALLLRGPTEHRTVLVRRDGRAAFDPGADPGGNLVEAALGALTLLVTGRGDPERWGDLGRLRWEGPVGERFVRRARLFG